MSVDVTLPFNENGLLAVIKPTSPFFYEDPVSLGKVEVEGGVRMCAHSYMNGGRICNGVYIGRYCSIGYNVTLGTGHHDMTLLSTSSWFNSDAGPTYKYVGTKDVKVRILNDVWIGSNATVMNGVLVGNGAVIGAGAVVTRDVPDYAVVAGVPAKILRYRFTELQITRLLATRWWEFDDVILKEHRLKDIETSLAFLEKLSNRHRVSKKLIKI